MIHSINEISSNRQSWLFGSAHLAEGFFRHDHVFEQGFLGDLHAHNHVEFPPQILHCRQADPHFLSDLDVGELVATVGFFLIVIDKKLNFLSGVTLAVTSAIFTISMLLQAEFVPQGTFGIGLSF